MIYYAVDKGKTFFSKDYSQLSCSFSYLDDITGDEFFGMFVGDVNWAGYFIDPIICRFMEIEAGASWLGSMDSDLTIINDLYYNKLVEYISLASDENGLALEIDDEDFDTITSDSTEGDLYSEREEVKLFKTMFHSVIFIEAFKDELDDPAKDGLLSAIAYFQEHDSSMFESTDRQSQFHKILRDEV
jgi:hypothetical protein